MDGHSGLLSGAPLYHRQAVPCALGKQSSRRLRKAFCALPTQRQETGTPETEQRSKRNQQKLDRIKSHRRSLAEVRKSLQEKREKSQESVEALLGRVLSPLVRYANYRGGHPPRPALSQDPCKIAGICLFPDISCDQDP